MKKFMLLFMAPVSAEQQMNVSAEDMQKGMEPWFAYFAKYGEAILDKGMPLGNGIHVTTEGSSERKTQVAGYSIIQAKNIEAAQSMLADHPHLTLPGGSIEVLEILPMTGM